MQALIAPSDLLWKDQQWTQQQSWRPSASGTLWNTEPTDYAGNSGTRQLISEDVHN